MPANFMFGSFGDIVAVLQLAWQLRAALDDAHGACAEIQSLIEDVDAFIGALQNIQAFVERRRKTLRPDVVNGLCAALGRCRDTLRTVVQKIKRAEARVSGSTWHRHLGRAAWSVLGTKKEVNALRQHLAEQINIIQLYLGLSQAHDQNAVEVQLARQGATLEHICGVLHDMQIRFDVGVPSFRFNDRNSGRYYAPLARTSLQRLNEIMIAADCQSITSYLEARSKLPWEDVLNCVQSKRVVKFSYRTIRFGCLFFQEAAFGQWQTLIYTGPRVRDGDRIFKHLLERGHSIDEACNCDMRSCSAIHQYYLQQERKLEDAMQLYAEAAQVLLHNVFETALEYDSEVLRVAMLKAFARLPSPDFIHSIWMPRAINGTLRSPDAMWKLLLAAPSIDVGRNQKLELAISPMRGYIHLWAQNVQPILHSLLISV